MKKLMVLAIGGLMVISSIVLVGCGSPEKTLISRYIQAVRIGDKDSIVKISLVPVKVDLARWKVISTTQPAEGKTTIADLQKKMNEAKKNMEDIQEKAALAKLDFDDFNKKYEKWSRARKRAKKKKYEELKTKADDLKAQFLKAKEDYNNAQMEFGNEKKLMALSVGDISEIEKLAGKVYSEEIVIEGTDSQGKTKKFKFYLVRYELTKEGVTTPIRGRWVVKNIEELTK